MTGVDAAKEILGGAAQQGPVVYLAVIVLLVAALLGSAVLYGVWKVAQWTAPRADEGFRAHVELMSVMKAGKVAEDAHRDRLEELHKDHIEAVQQVRDEMRGFRCQGMPAPRPGDAG